MKRATIAMTGASGFLGSHVHDLLVKAGHEVKTIGRRGEPAIDLLERGPPWERLGAPDTLLHCAGIMAADEASVLDSATMASNLLRGLVPSVRRLVLVSTAYVYAPSSTRVSEDVPVRPADVYAHTKVMVEELFSGLARATKRALVILRPCAIYGPGDPHRKAITAFVAAARNGQAPTLNGPVTFPRDYIHVRDAARAVMAAIEDERRDEAEHDIRVFNVCTGSAWSAVDLVRIIGKIRPALWVPNDSRDSDAVGYRFDPSRATRELRFSAEVALEPALEALLEEPALEEAKC